MTFLKQEMQSEAVVAGHFQIGLARGVAPGAALRHLLHLLHHVFPAKHPNEPRVDAKLWVINPELSGGTPLEDLGDESAKRCMHECDLKTSAAKLLERDTSRLKSRNLQTH